MPIFPADETFIARAAKRLRDGELVAFPTETVYGLGANALDARAVAKIYAAKGRPSYNPLIVHVPSLESAQKLTSGWNERAQTLAQAFWPGPLTLVLPKTREIPSIVSAGLETVALRVPSQPIALELLEKARIPLAAPSANASGQVSPTRAEHVRQSLGEEIWVLDGGMCEIGIESTVVDVSGDFAAILRPGMIGAHQIEALIGPLSRLSSQESTSQEAPRPSPGMLERHYAPRARVHIYPTLIDAHFHRVLLGAGRKVGILALHATRIEGAREVLMPPEPALYARQLYAHLRQLDEEGFEVLLVEELPDTQEWQGVRDRLKRAAQNCS